MMREVLKTLRKVEVRLKGDRGTEPLVYCFDDDRSYRVFIELLEVKFYGRFEVNVSETKRFVPCGA